MAPTHSVEQNYTNAWRAFIAAIKAGNSTSGHERNMAFLNVPSTDVSGGRGFADISAVSGLDFDDDARAVALVDWDRDGDLDLWFHNRTAPALRLMINRMSAEENRARFVALRLEGTKANRDAIGARVEIELADGSLLVRELAAGNGFLSQSSKTLHFGLGDDTVIDRVTVRWPWGEQEEFSGVHAGAWFKLVQGKGKAAALVVQPQPRELATTTQALAPPGSGRSLLSNPTPPPALNYHTPAGESRTLGAAPNHRLVVFWASWCPHCTEELKRLGAASGVFQTAGIEVVGVNVDQAIAGPDSDARAAITEAGFPYPWGYSDGDTFQKLKQLEHALLDRDTELVVPYSCLLDPHGNVSAFYRGRVTAQQIMQDAALPSGDHRRAAISGFGGLTFTSSNTSQSSLVDIGIEFQNRFPLEAIRYLKRSLPADRGDPETNPVTRRIAAIYYLLGLEALQGGDLEAAEGHCRDSIEFRPRLHNARLNLSVALFRLGRGAEAKAELEQLLKLDPGHAAARANLAEITERLKKSGDQGRP